MQTHSPLAAPTGSALPIETPKATFGVGVAEQDPMRNFGYTVAAYAIVWAVLLAFVFLSWRRQAAIEARLAGLERALERGARP